MRKRNAQRLLKWTIVPAAALMIGALWIARPADYDELVIRTGAPKELRSLAAIQRFTESRGNPKIGLGIPDRFPSWAEPRLTASPASQAHESEAAEAMYDRNADYLLSPFPRARWIFGSGGLYGLIPAAALSPWRDTDALRRGEVGPDDVFDPWRSTVFFVDYVRRLVDRPEFRNLPPEEQTILALKRGMASPLLVADYRESEPRSRSVHERAIEAAKGAGVPESDLLIRVPLNWPNYPGARVLVP